LLVKFSCPSFFDTRPVRENIAERLTAVAQPETAAKMTLSHGG
jgi:hypothetical protein